MMQAFESSALLIAFVILGKYLESRAKAATSKAVSSLAELTPEAAALVGRIPLAEMPAASGSENDGSSGGGKSTRSGGNDGDRAARALLKMVAESEREIPR